MRSNLGQAPAELRASPGAGTLPASWLQTPAPARALHQLLRRAQCGEATASYGPAEGDPLLRELLARQLAELDVPARMEDLLLCNGATQALDLVLRALTRPGDAVLVEQPGWPLPFAQAARCGLEQLAVARRGDGPDLQQVEGWARTRRPRLMLLVSRLHNPTGSSLGCACAHRLLELARQYGFLLVEDDVYAALCEQASPLLSAMDRLQRTVLIGGFSKLLAPGWRVGYLAAPPEQMTRLREAKLLGGLASPLLTERALALLLQRGGLHRHAAALRARLARARQLAVHLARQHECRFLFPPRGLFGWVDTGVDTERLARGLHRQGYLIAPGHCFDPVGAAGSCMRLNFAQAQDASFWQAFATMRRALRDDAERGAE